MKTAITKYNSVGRIVDEEIQRSTQATNRKGTARLRGKMKLTLGASRNDDATKLSRSGCL